MVTTKYFIDIYAVNYNVLRITNGMGGLDIQINFIY